jgi:flagellar protein FlaG
MYVQAQNTEPAPNASARSTGGAAVRGVTGSTAAAAQAEGAVQVDKAEDPNAVRAAVAAINRAAKSLTNTVQLVMDDRSEQAVVRVMDSETGQLIRQIPTEEVLELRRALDRISGLLIHRTA